MRNKLFQAMEQTVEAVDQMLNKLIPNDMEIHPKLLESIRYSLLNGGKRFRPLLVLATAEMFNVARQCAIRVAAAVEMIHCYSLIHDDLPAMDNSPLRRGQDTNHIKFDESTAILAGDGLLSHAFYILADEETHADPKVRCELVKTLSLACGPLGMVGGQMLDIAAEKSTLSIGEIIRMQRLKTGAMFAFACEAGAILGHAQPTQRQHLRAYAYDMGLAFQIIDDILDVYGTKSKIGKPTGQDQVAQKATILSLLGKERAFEQANALASQSILYLEEFEEKADVLKEIAKYAVSRDY